MSNLASILESRLGRRRLGWLRSLSEAGRDRAAGIYLVGGVVRDLLLKRPILELDISVSGLDEALALHLADALGGRLTARSQFNTFKIAVGSTVIDLAMTRGESYAHPGALPDVWPGSIEQDLARRDFSVNAMATDLSVDAWGELLDPMSGQRDLERRLIRVLHPNSFADDATRIFRAVRYAQRLEFRLEEGTADLLEASLGGLDTISGDRLRHEFQRVFAEPHPGSALSRLADLGVLEAVFPPLGRRSGPWPDENGPSDEAEELVWLSTLACGLTAGEAAQFAQRLNMGSAWAAVVRDTVEIEGILNDVGSPGILRSSIYHLLHQYHPGALVGVVTTHGEGLARDSIDLYLRELRQVRPELNGRDLIGLGAEEGPEIGRLLETVLEARLDGVVTSRAGEESLVRRLIS
ncbi:MAG: CCA tRNA nucleotidyltransferase [Chloroflexi bacterium]|nr:CCA tRNA nucleotidyltransferase [Chloroflexota bacterium]